MLFNSLEKLKTVFECVNYTEDKNINSYEFDSRNIQQGDVFVALKAERDGHDFIAKAVENGATAAIVEEINPNFNIPQFKVDNTWQALELLGNKSRAIYKGKTIGVTGSCGKTTVKDMLSHCLENSYATKRSFNGLLGLPVTLTHLNQNSDYAILEMGTDAFNQIQKLTHIAKPEIAIITSIGPTHLETFGTVSNIVKEKFSIAEGLPSNGKIIIPHEYLSKAPEGITVFDFSLYNNKAYAYIDLIENHKVTAKIGNQFIVFELADTASHKLTNALIVFITLEQLGFNLKDIAKKITSFTAPSGRGEQTVLANEITLYDESYNANPLSVSKALESFKNMAKNKKVVILGDMLELGPDEILLHKQLANYLDGIDRIYTFGPLMKHLHNELENKGFICYNFATREDLLNFLPKKSFKRSDILIKGSLGMKMIEIVDYFKKNM